MGFDGPVGLNDSAICNAMDTYFEVDKKDKLELSLAVRYFYSKMLKVLREKKK